MIQLVGGRCWIYTFDKCLTGFQSSQCQSQCQLRMMQRWKVAGLDRLHLWQASTFSLETQLKTLSSGQCVELTHCPLYFTFKNAILDKLTVQCLSWEVNNPSQIETDATKSQAWHQLWRKSPQHRKVWHRPSSVRLFWHKYAQVTMMIGCRSFDIWHVMHGDYRSYISDTSLERRSIISH